MVYLVGAGPGDPALMTLKGQALLSSCGALVYDHPGIQTIPGMGAL